MKSHTKSTLLAFIITTALLSGLIAAKHLLPSGPYFAPDYSCDKAMAQRLQQLTKQYKDSLDHVSIQVYDITADSLLYAYNAREALTPASCQKIITTFAAYDHLADYKNAFADSLMAVGALDSAGAVKGHLFLRGSYDPLLRDFSSFAKALKAKGIKIFYGDLICQLRVEQKYENADIRHDSLPVLYKGKDEVAADLLNSLAKQGIKVTGKTRFVAPGDTLPFSYNDTIAGGKKKVNLLYAEGHTLEEIMSHLMQHSDNRSAEAVFFCLSASTGHGKMGNEYGATIIRQSLKKFFPSLTESQCRIVDGSGLSHDNKASSQLLVDLLRVSHNYGLLGHFLVDEALPKSGSTGTLKQRMKGSPAEGNICAKTGTLPMYPASSLAGYCQSTRGHLLAFSIISNGAKSKAGNEYIYCAKRFEDAFCIEMCR